MPAITVNARWSGQYFEFPKKKNLKIAGKHRTRKFWVGKMIVGATGCTVVYVYLCACVSVCVYVLLFGLYQNLRPGKYDLISFMNAHFGILNRLVVVELYAPQMICF